MKTDYTAKDVARFWSHVDIKPDPDACWEWTAAVMKNGYGELGWGKKRSAYAHRVAYLISTGDDPEGFQVMHSCDNRVCCNPRHLSKGTHALNMDDRDSKGRVRHGETHPCAKITDAQVIEIRRRYAAGGISQKRLGHEYGVGQNAIWKIVTYLSHTRPV